MATKADILAPICETKREEGEEIEDHATNASLNKIHKEEVSQAETLESNFGVKHVMEGNESSEQAIEAEHFLGSPSITKDSCEANHILTKACKVAEQPVQTVKEDTEISFLRNTKVDDQPIEHVGTEGNLCDTSISDREREETVVSSVPEAENPNLEEMILKDKGGDTTTIEPLILTGDEFEREHPSEQNIAVKGEGENAKEEEGGSLKSKLTDKPNSHKVGPGEINLEAIQSNDNIKDRNIDKEEILYDGNATPSTPILIPSEEIEHMENNRRAERDMCNETMITAIPDKHELHGKQDTESSFLQENNSVIQKDGTSVITQGDCNMILESTVENESKTIEEDVTIQSIPTTMEENEETSSTQADDSQLKHDDHLENENDMLTEATRDEINTDASTNMLKVNLKDHDLTKAGVFQKEKDANITLLNEEAQKDKSTEFFPAAVEDINASASAQDTDTTSLEDRQLTADVQEISSDQTNERIADAVDPKEDCLEIQNVSTTVSYDEREKNSMTEVDDSQVKNLEKESKESTMSKVGDGDYDGKVAIDEPKVENEEVSENAQKSLESSNIVPEDIKASPSSQCVETAIPLQRQNITSDHQEILDNEEKGKAMDAFEEEETQNIRQNVTVVVPQQENEENNSVQVDGSQMGHEHPTENEKPSSAEAFDKGANDDKTTVVHKLETEDEDLRRAEPYAKEENIVCSSLEEEAPEKEPVESLHVTSDAIKVLSLSQENETTNSQEDDSLNADAPGITEEKTTDEADKKGETFQTESALATVANEDTEGDSAIIADGSQMVFLKKENEKPLLTETSAGFRDAGLSEVMHEAETNDEDLKEVELKKKLENTVLKKEVSVEKPIEYSQEDPAVNEAPASCQDIDTDSCLGNENLTATLDDQTEERIVEASDTKEVTLRKEEEQMEKSADFLHTVAEDINASTLGQDTDASFLEDGRLAAGPLEIQSVKTERIADAADSKRESIEAENVPTTVSYEATEDNSMIEADDCQVKNLEKESKEPTTREAPVDDDSEAEKIVINEPKIKNEEVDAHSRKAIESSDLVPENIQASPSIQCMETMISLQGQSVTTNHQEILDDEIEGKTVDAVKEKETLNVQNVTTVVPEQKSEEIFFIRDDGSQMKSEEHFKEIEKPSLVEAFNKDANDGKSNNMHELETDEDLRRGELFENEGNSECSLPKAGGLAEKHAESDVANEGIKATSSQEKETTNSLEDDRLNLNPKGIQDGTMEQKIIDEAAAKEETLQAESIPTIVACKDTEENSSIPKDGSQMVFLEKEMEKPSVTETSAVFTGVDSSEVMHEVKTGNEDLREQEKNLESTELKKEDPEEKPTEYSQDYPEDNTIPALCHDIHATSCVGVETLTANPQGVLDNRTEEKIYEATHAKEETHELRNNTTIVPNDEIEEKSSTKVFESQTKHEEHSLKEGEEPIQRKAPTGEASDAESNVIHDSKIKNEDLQESELSVNSLLKEDAPPEQSVESLGIVPENIETYDSSQNMKTISTLEEQSLTSDPQGILDDNIEETKMVAVQIEETFVENIEKYVPTEETEESILIQVDDSQVKHEEHIKKGSEKTSLMEASSKDINVDESITAQILETEEEDLKRAEFLGNDDDTETTPPKEETKEESTVVVLHIDPEDDSTVASSENSEILNSLQDESPSENAHESLDCKMKEKINDVANQKEKSLEVQNVTASVPNVEPEEDSSFQLDSSVIEHLEKEKKIESSEALIGFQGASSSEVVDVLDTRDEDLKEAELSHSKTNIECALLKKEAQVEKLTEYLQADPHDIKPSGSSHDTDTSSLEEHSVAVNPQAIGGDQTAQTTDAANLKEESLEAQKVATIFSKEDTKDDSFIHEDGLKMKYMESLEKDREEISLSEAARGAAKDDESTVMEETLSVDESETKAEFPGNEQNRESTLAEEERQMDKFAESLQPPEDIKVSNKDTDLTRSRDPQNNQGDSHQTEATTTSETDMKGETPETEKFFTTALDNTEQSQLIQVNDSQMKHDEHLEIHGKMLTETLTRNNYDTESKTMHEAGTGVEDVIKAELFGKEQNTESTLLKQGAETEHPLESLQVVPVDIKVCATGLDTETSSRENQRQAVDPEGTIADKADAETTDAADSKEKSVEVQNTAVISNEAINGVISHCNADNKNSSGVLEEEKSSESVSVDVNQIQDVNGARTTLEDNKYTSAREVLSTDTLLPGEREPQSDRAFESKEISQDKNAGRNIGETSPQLGASPCKETSEIKSGADTVSMLEEVPPVKDVNIYNNNDQSDNVKNQDKENIIESHEASEVQSRETKDEVQEDPEITSKDSGIDLQMLDDKNHVETHAEATANETVKTFQETAELDGKESSAYIDKDQVENADAYTEEKVTTMIPIQEVQEIYQEVKEGESCEADKKRIIRDTEVTGEIEHAANKVKTAEIKEEGYIRDLHTIAAGHMAIEEEKGIDSDIKIPERKVSDVSEDVVVNTAEDPNCEQNKTTIMEPSDEEAQMSHEKFTDITSVATEASEENSGHKSVAENSCNEKTDFLKMEVHDDDPTTIPRDYNLLEEDAKDSTETQEPHVESKLDMQQVSVAGNSQKQTEEEQLLASEDVSSSEPFQESRRETLMDSEKEEAQRQYQDFHLSALINDSPMEAQKDVQLYVANTEDSDITQERQNIEGAIPPALDERIVEKTDSKENEVAESTANYEHIEQVQMEDTTESIPNDLKETEGEQEKLNCKEDNVILDEEQGEIKDLKSIDTANDFLQESVNLSAEVEDHSTVGRELRVDDEELQFGKTAADENEEARTEGEKGREEEPRKQKASDGDSDMIEAGHKDLIGSAKDAPEEEFTGKVAEEAKNLCGMTDVRESTVIKNDARLKDILVNDKYVEEIATKSSDEIPEIAEITSTFTEGRAVQSTSFEETSTSGFIPEEAEHIASPIEEKSELLEVEYASRENITGNDPTAQNIEDLKSCEISIPGNDFEESEKDIVSREHETVYDTKSESLEEVTGNNIINPVPNTQKNQDPVMLYKDAYLETSSKYEGNTDDVTTESYGVNETSPGCIEEDTLNDEEKMDLSARKEEVDSFSESKEIIAPKNPEEVLETVTPVKNHNLSSKEAEAKSEEVPTEIKSDKLLLSEETFEPEETTEANMSREKIKEVDEDAYKEEIILPSHQETEASQKEEPRVNREEIFEVVRNDNEEAPKVLEETDVSKNIITQVASSDKGDSLENESIDRSLNQKEDRKSSQEVNSSAVEDNIAGFDEIDNQTIKDAGSLDENTIPTTVVSPAELPEKLDENTISEVVPTEATHAAIEDFELRTGYENSSTNQQQETEKWDKKNEICTSEKVQVKDQVTEMLSAEKSEEKAREAGVAGGLTEDDDVRNCIETGKVDFSIDTKDQTEILQTGSVQEAKIETDTGAVPEMTKVECEQEESTGNVLSTVNKDTELIEQGSEVTEINAEMQEQRAGTDYVAVPEAVAVLCGEKEIVSDDYKGQAESRESTKLSTSKIMQENTLEGSLLSEDQETRDHFLNLDESSNVPHVEKSSAAIAQKTGPMDLLSASEITGTVQVSDKGSGSPSIEENLIQADASKNADAKVSIGGSEAVTIQQLTVSNSLKHDTQEEQPGKPTEAASASEPDKHVFLEADQTNNANPDKKILAPETTDPEESSPAQGSCEEEERTSDVREKLESLETDKPASLSDLLQVPGKEAPPMPDDLKTGEEPDIHRKELQAEKPHEEAKSDNEKESSGEKDLDSCSEAPVMVDAGDADVKAAHKKSHNILSGVGSKVKHSIAKVKKAITGKSSHPKPPSPK